MAIEGRPRQLETERDGKTRPAPFERRAPTAEYRTRERTLAYISIPFTAPRRLGPAPLALPIAIHRDPSIPFSFSFLGTRRRRRRRRRSILLLIYICIYIVVLRVIYRTLIFFTRSLHLRSRSRRDESS